MIGIDTSAELIQIAREKARCADGVEFHVGNILDLPSELTAEAILCRGVLNDFPSEESRRDVFKSFSRGLAPGGILILDVRDWENSKLRKRSEPVFEKRVSINGGVLVFRSETRVNDATRSLEVTEIHRLEGKGTPSRPYAFRMKCWTPDELHSNLSRAGFENILFYGDFDFAVAQGSTDRIIGIATRGF